MRHNVDMTAGTVIEALADPVRRQVVTLLSSRPRRAGELAAEAGMSAPAMSRQLRVAVDAQTAFRAFTAEMDLWWVRGPINFFDAARAVAKVCEEGVGGRILEVYESGDPLEVARITAWEPGVLVAWDSSVDDVRTEVRFTPTPSGTLVRVTATIPDGGADRGGTSYVRVVPPWFGAWCARRADAPRTPAELARLAVAVYYPKPAG